MWYYVEFKRGHEFMAHMSRKEYRIKAGHQNTKANRAKSEYSRSRANDKRKFSDSNLMKNMKENNSFSSVGSRRDYTHVKLNFWTIFSDRPYVAVALIVIAIFMAMIKFWWGFLVLIILIAIGIYIIGHSHHPHQVLSIEFKMQASRKLSMLRALQLGGSVLMFLATYMKQVVSVNFSSAGSTDSLQIVEGVLSNRGGSYGQQGTYLLDLLNTFTGGQLFSSYRYAANSAQMMNSASGKLIVMWILLLMIAPAFCVLAQFFKEPYARNVTLISSIIAMISFLFTPYLMHKWVTEYGIENQMTQMVASNAFSIGKMAYVAIGCSIGVMLLSLYRFIKKDNF